MALSTTRTLLTQTGINTHQVLNVGGLDSAGIATFLNFKTGESNVHSIGFDVVSSTGAGVTIRSTGNAAFSGIVTAAGFVGDGSGLIGVASTDNINTSTLAKLSGGMVVGGAVTFTGTVEGAADIVFLGFKRDANSNLILYYTEKGNTDTFETKDYEHKGGAQWLMGSGAHLHSTSSLAAIGSTTRPDGSTPQVGEPKYRFIPSGHLTINI